MIRVGGIADMNLARPGQATEFCNSIGQMRSFQAARLKGCSWHISY
jgi:hypothetical protein